MDAISGSLGKEDFLQLLTTQLMYLDPLNPLDSTDFTAQLAEFSSLEQLYNMNSSLEGILSYQNSLNNAMATSLIGRTVTVDSNTFTLQGTADLRYSLDGDASQVSVTVYDASGNPVKTVDLGPKGAGDQSFTWDGTDDSGKALASGTYTFSVTATDQGGNLINADTSTTALVTGVEFDDGLTYLVLDNGMKVALSDIMEIHEQGGA